jgi:hypothetical protein
MAEIHYIRDSSPRKVPEDLAPPSAPAGESAAGAELFCAYNETRQSFVATEVETAIGADAVAQARLHTMEPGSGTALWISPYCGISPSSARFPLDLVFLDKDSTVLETVEFFPMNVGGEATAQAASILVLAADILAQVQVRAGDRLKVVAREEMLHLLPGPRVDAEPETPEAVPRYQSNGGAQSRADGATAGQGKSAASVAREESGNGALARAMAETLEKLAPAAGAHGNRGMAAESATTGNLIETARRETVRKETAIESPIAARNANLSAAMPAAEAIPISIPGPIPATISLPQIPAADELEPPVAPASPREPWNQEEMRQTWLDRVLDGEIRDPRTFPRLSPPQLFAYYFTGGPPAAHAVRDISTSGLYIVTGERWYIGTIVQLTLTDRLRPKGAQSISLFGKVMRWGKDGVGLKFLVEGLSRRPRVERHDVYEPTNGVSVTHIGEFVSQFTAS